MDRLHWLDRRGTLRVIRRGSLIVLALTVLTEAIVDMHPHFEAERLFGFYAWFGLVSCAAMILVAKAVGLLLKRPDTYYDEAGDG